MNNRKTEIGVGLFISAGLIALLFLALQVANTGAMANGETYILKAKFDNIGGLKVRSPVKVGGVVVGRVSSIQLENLVPVVSMEISQDYHFPETSSLSILTAGLLGEQYLGLEPGFTMEGMEIEILKNEDYIQDTKSALVLEELIGQFLFGQNNED
ncbi:outer membrane lipid asymmetry maintenance protein MlaD [Catenovulum sp. 2E275]|uniref:outer membrane lipid asymmetry maintenance protein MlaD n=1 Tax=Catenovulum sp. 2E275 TaxID=2980497 RepID=UPI0021D1233F|nr:outer membrane lipid asymmetry maintenance protein MlaD [Catenovulum sp. 2E275]MCU4675469.1 outer membrane lipid asymmetry maintenance protein MlaD [Catenovulum sp. 2E275]